MFRHETPNGDQRTERGRGGGQLRKGLPLAAAAVAGYLLWRRFEGASAEQSEGDGTTATEVASRIRQRMGAGGAGTATDEVLFGRTGATEDVSRGADHTGATVPVDVGGSDVERAVDSVSVPTRYGMPMLGVGTHHHAKYDECYENVREALEIGYRHVDTTVQREAYYNEPAVGDAIADADVAREDVFVATKVDPSDLDPDHVRISVEESLDRLGTEYVDLLYPRWPTGEYDIEETQGAFADLRQEGLIRYIGVSNFTVDLLEQALDASGEPIFANQVEMHPLLPQSDLREFCEQARVELIAYSPLARGDVEDVDELREVAARHDASPEQISLAWLREKGVSAIPRATRTDHLRENWLSLGVDLDAEDVAMLDSIEQRRRVVDPDDAPWNR